MDQCTRIWMTLHLILIHYQKYLRQEQIPTDNDVMDIPKNIESSKNTTG